MKVVLSIAGSDSSGGAGIQADIKTIAAQGLYAQTVITALTAQNTQGVSGVLSVDPEFVALQLQAVFHDIRPDAVKIGMISSPDIVRAVAEGLRRHQAANIVVDPVMVATSGAALSQESAVQAEVESLFGLASVITPNLPEAEVLAGGKMETDQDMQQAALDLARAYGSAVLIKGGHRRDAADDVLALPSGSAQWFRSKRIDNPNTHGTGCTLSSAIACGLAEGLTVPQAIGRAKDYLAGALRANLNLGSGSGPLDHAWQQR